jgi:transcriptional regulator GlxA family with amidase domain
LESNYADEQFSVEQLATRVNLSRSQLHRKLIALTGQAPNRLIRTFRLKKAYDMVTQHAASIAEIGFKVGFNSPAYFTKCFEEEFGHTPSEIKNRSINA